MIIRSNRTNQPYEIPESPNKLIYSAENDKVYRIIRRPYEGEWIYKADNPNIDLDMRHYRVLGLNC